MPCNQAGCRVTPAYRYTWPGREEAETCADHAEQIKRIADAMGVQIQLIPLDMAANDMQREPPIVRLTEAIKATRTLLEHTDGSFHDFAFFMLQNQVTMMEFMVYLRTGIEVPRD